LADSWMRMFQRKVLNVVAKSMASVIRIFKALTPTSLPMDYATEAADNAPPIRNLPSSDSESSESELEAESHSLDERQPRSVATVVVSISANGTEVQSSTHSSDDATPEVPAPEDDSEVQASSQSSDALILLVSSSDEPTVGEEVDLGIYRRTRTRISQEGSAPPLTPVIIPSDDVAREVEADLGIPSRTRYQHKQRHCTAASGLMSNNTTTAPHTVPLSMQQTPQMTVPNTDLNDSSPPFQPTNFLERFRRHKASIFETFTTLLDKLHKF
jgi:hypothetical protein